MIRIILNVINNVVGSVKNIYNYFLKKKHVKEDSFLDIKEYINESKDIDINKLVNDSLIDSMEFIRKSKSDVNNEYLNIYDEKIFSIVVTEDDSLYVKRINSKDYILKSYFGNLDFYDQYRYLDVDKEIYKFIYDLLNESVEESLVRMYIEIKMTNSESYRSVVIVSTQEFIFIKNCKETLTANFIKFIYDSMSHYDYADGKIWFVNKKYKKVLWKHY